MTVAAEPPPSDELPVISNDAIARWLVKQVESSRASVEKCRVLLGEEGFDQAKYRRLQYTQALFLRLQELLSGVFAEPPGMPPGDLDEQFFSILSNAYGYDVTKPRPTSTGVSE